MDYAHERGVQVEGELGTIAGVEEDIVAKEGKGASYEDSLIYLEKTGIDAFAPAIGTAHGVYKGVPKIDFDLVDKLCQNVSCPIVIHGGTGLSDETFQRLIGYGASKINVSTALKIAYLVGFTQYTQKYPNKVDPLLIDEVILGSITEAVKGHIQVFNSVSHQA